MGHKVSISEGSNSVTMNARYSSLATTRSGIPRKLESQTAFLGRDPIDHTFEHIQLDARRRPRPW